MRPLKFAGVLYLRRAQAYAYFSCNDQEHEELHRWNESRRINVLRQSNDKSIRHCQEHRRVKLYFQRVKSRESPVAVLKFAYKFVIKFCDVAACGGDGN